VTPKQSDVFIEMFHLGSAQGANVLSKMMPDGHILVDVPRVFEATQNQIRHSLQSMGERVLVSSFSIEGDGFGQLWWILTQQDATTVESRIQRSSRATHMAVTEAANVVASAVLSGIGTMAHAHYLPSTPEVRLMFVADLAAESARTFSIGISAAFCSMNGPLFKGVLVVLLDDETKNDLITRVTGA
jgi:chemotaxis protein CheC